MSPTTAAARPRVDRMDSILVRTVDVPEHRLQRTRLRRGAPGFAIRAGPRTVFRGLPDAPWGRPTDSDAINRRPRSWRPEMDALTQLLLAIAVLIVLEIVSGQLRKGIDN